MAGEGDDEEVVTGTEGEGAEGSDTPERDDEGEVSAEQPDDQADDGEQEVADGGEKPSRGQSRIQRLANETKAAREEAAAARREAEELRRAQYARQEQQTEQQQREMLALMTPEERAEWRIQQMERRTAHERQQDRFQIQSMLDKNAFEAKAAVHPVYAKYQSVIEEQFQAQLRKGQPVEREILLQNHLGKLALDAASKSGGERRKAKSRVESQRVPAGSGKGDTQADRGKAGDTAEKRLTGVYI